MITDRESFEIVSYFQMEHYRKVLGGIRQNRSEGFVGVGNAKARFGKGVILILGENGMVKKAPRMRGMTVFTKFKEALNFLSMELDELRGEQREGGLTPGAQCWPPGGPWSR